MGNLFFFVVIVNLYGLKNVPQSSGKPNILLRRLQDCQAGSL